MKILDILFVVFELYNFVGLFKLRIQGLPDEVEKFSEQLKKGGYHFLMESDDYPNRNSEYVRRYVEIRLKEQE